MKTFILFIGILFSSFYYPYCPSVRIKASPNHNQCDEAPNIISYKYPIKVSYNNKYFTDQNNTPFPYIACTGWSLLQKLKREDIEIYFENRKNKGFTVIQITLLPWEKEDTNAYGDYPFLDSAFFEKPNPSYFDYVEWVMKKARDMNLVLSINLVWLRNNWSEEMTVERCREYGEFLAERFKEIDNVIWFGGGDINPIYRYEESLALVKTLNEKDTSHLISFHCGRYKDGSSTTSSTFFHTHEWLDFNMGYAYSPYNSPRLDPYCYVQLHSDYQRKPTKPVILGESYYEFRNYGYEPEKVHFALRRNMYWALTCGAAGVAYGNWSIFPFDEDWKNNMDQTGSWEMKHFANLMKNIEWWTLIPDIHHEFLISGSGNYGAGAYCTAAYNKEGTLAVIYVPTKPQYIKLTVNMEYFNDPVQARWYDPTSGKYLKIQENIPNHGNRVFIHPERNNANNEDFILLMESK